MNLSYFKEFLVLAEVKNYWEAAESLYISQATLTRHIKQMEDELEVPLFNRTTRHVSLTDYGKAFIPYANKIIETESEYLNALAMISNNDLSQITLGVIPSMTQYHITDLIHDFTLMNPGCRVKLDESDTCILKERLLEHHVGLAFLRESEAFPILERSIEKTPFTKDHMVVVLPKDHPLAACKELKLEQIISEQFIFLEESSIIYKIIESIFTKAGYEMPKSVMECVRLDSILALVAQGMGITILTNRHFEGIQVHHDRSLTAIPLTPTVFTNTYLCRNKKFPLSGSEKRLWKFFQQINTGKD